MGRPLICPRVIGRCSLLSVEDKYRQVASGSWFLSSPFDRILLLIPLCCYIPVALLDLQTRRAVLTTNLFAFVHLSLQLELASSYKLIVVSNRHQLQPFISLRTFSMSFQLHPRRNG